MLDNKMSITIEKNYHMNRSTFLYYAFLTPFSPLTYVSAPKNRRTRTRGQTVFRVRKNTILNIKTFF